MRKRFLSFSLDRRDTTAWWRMLPLKYINHPDIEIIDISDNKIFDWTTFSDNIHGFILQRPFSKDHINLLIGAKNQGLKIILDYDDDIWSVNFYNPTYQLYEENKKNANMCLTMADEVWTSTQAIKDYVKEINPNVTIIPNALNDTIFKIQDKKPFDSEKKKIYFRGGGSHRSDIYDVGIAEMIVETINDNLDWTFNFFGEIYDYIGLRTGDNCAFIPYMTIMEYFRYFNNDNPQLCIFPLRVDGLKVSLV